MKDRTNATHDDLQSVSSKNARASRASRVLREEEVPSKPVSWEDLIYLDHRDERAAMRDSYATAVQIIGKKPSAVIVRMSEWSDV